MKYSVILPVYNEAENIADMVRGLTALADPPAEIRIVDDHSPDGTYRLAQELQKEFPSVRAMLNPGSKSLAASVTAGFDAAETDLLLCMDADGQHRVCMMAFTVLRVTVRDPMSGFFAVRKESFRRIRPALSPDGFKIMLEILYLLTLSNPSVRVEECGIVFELRKKGESKLSADTILRYLRMLFALRFRKNLMTSHKARR